MDEKDKELEALEGALARASAAPWIVHPQHDSDRWSYIDGGGVHNIAGALNRDAAVCAALRNAAPSLISEIRAARAWRKEAEAAIRWALGEAPLPDGRWFDAAAFGLHDRVPPYWWRRFLRLHSGLGEREGNAP